MWGDGCISWSNGGTSLSMKNISGLVYFETNYSFKSVSNGCTISMNDIFYVHAPERNGLFLLNLDSSMHIHSIDAKRLKLSDDNFMNPWHCRLGHIGVKRMKKLHDDEI